MKPIKRVLNSYNLYNNAVVAADQRYAKLGMNR